VKLSVKEIAERKPVWCALSELYRDTELQPSELESIASTIREGNLSSEEAYRVLCNEVAPVFYINLLSVAGNWQGWDCDSVEEVVLEFLSKSRFSQWRGRVAARSIFLGRTWRTLKPYLD
jgi:hypothetical protein